MIEVLLFACKGRDEEMRKEKETGKCVREKQCVKECLSCSRPSH